MVNWFGPQAWGAPICHDAPRCDIPVGIPCARCGRAIEETDEGVTMPGSPAPVTFHLTCHLKSVLPHGLWAQAQLVPDESDGLVDGTFICRPCRVAYRTGEGWTTLLLGNWS